MPNYTSYSERMKQSNSGILRSKKAFNMVMFTLLWISVGALTLPIYLAYVVVKWRWNSDDKSDVYQSQIDNNTTYIKKEFHRKLNKLDDILKKLSGRVNELELSINDEDYIIKNNKLKAKHKKLRAAVIWLMEELKDQGIIKRLTFELPDNEVPSQKEIEDAMNVHEYEIQRNEEYKWKKEPKFSSQRRRHND